MKHPHQIEQALFKHEIRNLAFLRGGMKKLFKGKHNPQTDLKTEYARFGRECRRGIPKYPTQLAADCTVSATNAQSSESRRRIGSCPGAANATRRGSGGHCFSPGAT